MTEFLSIKSDEERLKKYKFYAHLMVVLQSPILIFQLMLTSEHQ